MSVLRIPYDRDGGVRVEILGPKDVRSLDEIVIGNWLHLERMNGVNKRNWWLSITDERGEQMHIWIGDKEGMVTGAHITEAWPPKDEK